MIGPADLATLQQAGLLPPGKYLLALHRVRDGVFWARWAVRALLALGVAHLLAGIVFFFAYNWDDMPAMAKFAVIEAGMLICVAGAWIVRIDRPAGQSLLIGATVLTGVLLAVIGQVYQTGADAYELFLAWTLLVLPWVLASRSAAHWLVWLVVACFAAGLFAGQALVPMGLLQREEVALPPALLLIVALAAREFAVTRGAGWLAAEWTRQLVLFAALAMLFFSAFGYVFDWHDEALGAAMFVLATAGGVYAFGKLRASFAALTQVIGFTGLFAMAVGVRLIDLLIDIDFSDLGRSLLGLGLVIVWLVAVTGSVGLILPAVRHRLPEGRG